MSSSSEILSATGLQTEFFQLVQTALYHADGMWGDATVDLYLRDLPESHGYMVVAGVEAAVHAVQTLRFSSEDVAWLRAQPMYAKLGPTFFDSLLHFRFSGDIWAVHEGTPISTDSPIMRITAPLPQVGLFEMLVTQAVGCASAVATNAARLSQAAAGRTVLDFGTRRIPGRTLAESAARAAFIGGCSGTTHALAARNLDIPVVGLISDSMLAAYEDVALAYDALSAHFPDGCHLNLPTEGPLEAIERFARIHDKVQTVRIDAPDLAGVSRTIRDSLDQKGMGHTRILGSGALDAQQVQQLVEGAAPIDLFAIGQALTDGITGSGPQLCYRLAALVRETNPVPITGHWSARWPGIKQVHRFADHDVVCAEVESPEQSRRGGTPLLHPWVLAGDQVIDPIPLRDIRAHCVRSVAALPESVRRLSSPDRLEVRPSQTILHLATTGS
jgi:nicotinate phosphoribosyltransferase